MIQNLVPTFNAVAIIAAGCSLIHPFGNPSSRGMKAPILGGAEIDPGTLGLIQRACQIAILSTRKCRFTAASPRCRG